MQKLVPLGLWCALLATGCSGHPSTLPATPSPVPNPAPTPGPVTFPSITIGDVVRFQFTADDVPCVGGGGRCRSYNITSPSDGWLEVVVTSVSGEDSWNVGPGPRISVTIPVRARGTYEIRMFSPNVPSVELELRASLQEG
jgi:hypothetical protein